MTNRYRRDTVGNFRVFTDIHDTWVDLKGVCHDIFYLFFKWFELIGAPEKQGKVFSISPRYSNFFKAPRNFKIVILFLCDALRYFYENYTVSHKLFKESFLLQTFFD